MDVPQCPGCRERDARIAKQEARIAELEKRFAELEARLGVNSSNSSVPPSANPLGAPKPVIKKKSGRKRGGQPGHPPHLRELLPLERVARFKKFIPKECESCHASLPAEPGPSDPEPTRFQTIELVETPTEVVEYQGHGRGCPDCGHLTKAVVPSEIRAHPIGPRLTAAFAYLAGAQGVSKRAVEEISDDMLKAPISLGKISNMEQEVSAALEAPHQEALQAVRDAEVKHADETSWKLAGKLCWLWVAAMSGVAAFVIHAKRSCLGLKALLGEKINGILTSDRWSVYASLSAERRQICWAHLKRDFQKVIDRGGDSASLGKRGRNLIKKVFAAWHEFQEGRLTREQLKTKMEPLEFQMNRVLIEGWSGDDPTMARFCAKVLALEEALWTFVTTEGVEPTNNFAERVLRLAVLWRRRSFGCQSEKGCRFVERILTVLQTRRLQGKSGLEYLHEAVQTHRTGKSCPTLLART